MATQTEVSETTQAAELYADQQQPTIDMDQLVADTIDRDRKRFEYAWTVGAPAAGSGFYPDVSNQDQAAMKIMTGWELGLPAAVSLRDVYIIKGRVQLSGEVIGALLQREGYDWKFGYHNENGCQLFLYRHGKKLLNIDGSHAMVQFSRKDAEAAELIERVGKPQEGKPTPKSMYDKYGMDMYFNRCIVRYQKRFAPWVTKGITVYTPDEIEEIMTREAANTQPPVPKPAPAMPQRKSTNGEESQ